MHYELFDISAETHSSKLWEQR